MPGIGSGSTANWPPPSAERSSPVPAAGPSRVLSVLMSHTESPWTASAPATPPAAGSAVQRSLDGRARHSCGAGVLLVQVPVAEQRGAGGVITAKTSPSPGSRSVTWPGTEIAVQRRPPSWVT